ncbi:MAG TPA: fatty acyl-AMP ligase [Acidobacteriota bacterium]|nr:fatty acyl-AMP ligase [Acidobacteriota bacterium]
MEETLNAMRDAVAHIEHKGYTFLDDDLAPSDWSFADISKEAKRIGARLQALGLAKGDRLALILNAPESFVLSFLGSISAGVMPVPMYPPLALGRLDNYIDRAIGILRVSGAKALLTTKDLIPVLEPVLSKVPTLKSVLDIEMLQRMNGDLELHETATRQDEPCFLQFTSGSTSAPRGVIVTHRNLLANARAIINSLEINSDLDKAVSWLPLYHDMGLIGFVIATLVAQIPVVFIPTIAFVKHPGIWMETVHKYRGTVTFGPNFAFELAAKRAAKISRSTDLSCLRVLGCGSEPINPKTMESFISAFAPLGLRRKVILPCYGMAEATLAIAFDNLHKPMQKLVIDRYAYETLNVARPIAPNDDATEPKNRFELVSCGRTIPDHEVRIMNDRGEILPDGRVGEIVFRGPSVTPGYFRNPEASRQLLQGGWLHTGDLGFILDGDLYISGRQKDLVIINGRNYPPQAIEWIVEEIAGIRKGSVVAFSVNGDSTEKLVIIAETTMTDSAGLTLAISEQVRSALGLSVYRVVLVGRGSIPKTSSGKLQRRQTKALFEGGQLGFPDNGTESSRAEGMALR